MQRAVHHPCYSAERNYALTFQQSQNQSGAVLAEADFSNNRWTIVRVGCVQSCVLEKRGDCKTELKRIALTLFGLPETNTHLLTKTIKRRLLGNTIFERLFKPDPKLIQARNLYGELKMQVANCKENNKIHVIVGVNGKPQVTIPLLNRDQMNQVKQSMQKGRAYLLSTDVLKRAISTFGFISEKLSARLKNSIEQTGNVAAPIPVSDSTLNSGALDGFRQQYVSAEIRLISLQQMQESIKSIDEGIQFLKGIIDWQQQQVATVPHRTGQQPSYESSPPPPELMDVIGHHVGGCAMDVGGCAMAEAVPVGKIFTAIGNVISWFLL